MDPVPERPDAPPPPPEPPKESFIGKYGARITRSENDKLLGRMSINRGGGVTEKIIINKYSKKADKIGDWVIERDPSSKMAIRVKHEGTGEVKDIKHYGGVPYIGNEPLGGDTSWLD